MFTLQKIIRSRVKRQTPPEGFLFEIDQPFPLRWNIDRGIRSFVVTNFKALAHRKRRVLNVEELRNKAKYLLIISILIEKIEKLLIIEKHEGSNKSACVS